MRKIKFRAWEKTLNEMIPVNNIDFIKQSINTDSAWRFLPEIELMQFTGLKDKNGVEIYEGDVIGVDLGDEYYFAIVKRGGWYWYGDMIFANDIIDFDDIGDETDMSADCDVLGNIHENPKLLEESK